MEPLECVRLAEINSVAADSVVDGRFRVESVVGAGEMSTVYRARDLHLDRPVALKVMHADLVTDKESILRFQREAIAATTLEHPNIVKVFSAGMWEGKPYVSMEFIEGETLSQLIKRKGRLEPDEVLRIFTQVFDGLETAHQSHVIHRDMKPSNIMLVGPDRDTVKIVDFGIAKILPQSGKGLETLTQTGRIVGSLGYMSPEQCMGFPVDARSDLYSTACGMYEALVGEPAISGRGYFQIMARQAAGEVKQSEFIDEQFEALILTLMQRDPADRLQSAVEAKQALDCIAQKKPHGINKPVRTKPQARVSGTASPLVKLLALLCLVTVAAAGFAWYQWSQRQKAVEQLRAEQRRELDDRAYVVREDDYARRGSILRLQGRFQQMESLAPPAWLQLFRSDLEKGDWSKCLDDALILRTIYDERAQPKNPTSAVMAEQLRGAELEAYIVANSMLGGGYLGLRSGGVDAVELLGSADQKTREETTLKLLGLANTATKVRCDPIAIRLLNTVFSTADQAKYGENHRNEANAALYCRHMISYERNVGKSFRERDASFDSTKIPMASEPIETARKWLAKNYWFDNYANTILVRYPVKMWDTRPGHNLRHRYSE